jgi:hypothetical protein
MDVDLRSLTNNELAEWRKLHPPAQPTPEEWERHKARGFNVISEDATGCCKAIHRAHHMRQLLDKDEWTCPKCGGTWKPRLVEGVRLWEFQAVFMVWK